MVKTLQLNLGTVQALQSPAYQAGWYRDQSTGAYYYYDGHRWFVYAQGILTPMTITPLPAPKTIQVAPGDQVKISISYNYSGPAQTSIGEYSSIGYRDGLGYHPKIENAPGGYARNLPASSSPVVYTYEHTLTIPPAVQTNWTTIECKVFGGSPGVPETGVDLFNPDPLQIVGLVASITDFKIVDFVKV